MKIRYKVLNGLLGSLVLFIATLMITLSYTADCPTLSTSLPGENKIRTVAQYCYGSSDLLVFEWVEKPQPKDNEVLVKVKHVSVNPSDSHLMRGSPYLIRIGKGIGNPERSVLGSDYSGIVESVGKNVTRFKPGDEVFGGDGGTFSEYISVREDSGITHKPKNISFDESAGVAVAAITALQALIDQGDLKPGEAVLINGASGGVGTFAVQIAKAFGGVVSGVSSTRNVEMVKALGADHVFDYKKESYVKSGRKFDLIVDMIGNHSVSDNRAVLSPGGRYVIVGSSKGNWLKPLIQPISAIIQDSFVDESLRFFVAEFRREDLDLLAMLIGEGKVKVQIDRNYRFDEISKAINYLETRRARGKVIVDID